MKAGVLDSSAGAHGQPLGISDAGNATPASPNATTGSTRGRACATCVRSKTKCSLPSTTGGKCERCFRRGRDCDPSPVAQKRGRPRIYVAAIAKVHKLEAKLNSIAAILDSVTRNATLSDARLLSQTLRETTSAIHDPGSYVPSASTGPGSHRLAGMLPHTIDTLSGSAVTAGQSTYSAAAISDSNQVRKATLAPGSEEAGLNLDRFRAEFIHQLPFIYIPDTVSSTSLHSERPLLWLAIMTVATPRDGQQKELSKEMRCIFGREAFVTGTRNMDLLLAVLVYAAWDRWYNLEKPLLTSLAHLAISLLYELGLDKPSTNDPSLVLTYHFKGRQEPSRFSSAPTLEHRRALLGTYLLSSTSSFARNGEPLRWSLYGDECLRILAEQGETKNDIVLAQMTKLRLISDRASELPWSDWEMTGHLAKPQAEFYIRSLQAQLQSFTTKLPRAVAEQKTLMLERHHAEICVYEMGFSPGPGDFTGGSNHRFECLVACLQSIKLWIDLFLTMPPSEYCGFHMGTYTMMARCFIDLWRLQTLDCPEWDCTLVAATIDLSAALLIVENNFARLHDSTSLQYGALRNLGFTGIMASRLGAMRASWELLIASTSSTQNNTVTAMESYVEFPAELLKIFNY